MPAVERSLLLILFLIILSFHGRTIASNNHLGFGFDNEKVSSTIPFVSYDNLIIVKATLDDKSKLNLILDTGIRSLVLFRKSYVPKVSDHTFNLEFTGAGSHKPIDAIVSVNHNLRLSVDVVANKINSVILNRSNSHLHKLKGIKIHGAFGYQLFSRFRVKIDYKNKLITLSEPVAIGTLEGFESIPLVIHDTKPFLEAQVLTEGHRWHTLNLVLDLGANHKILLLDKMEIKELFELSDGNHRIAEGLSSSIYGQTSLAESIKLGPVAFWQTEVLIPNRESYHHESMEVEKHGSVGGRLFEDSVIILDYVNSRLQIRQHHLPAEDPHNFASGLKRKIKRALR